MFIPALQRALNPKHAAANRPDVITRITMTSSQPPSGYSSSKVGLSALLILVLVPIMTYFMRISNTLTYQYRPTPLPAVGRGMDMTQRVDVFSMEVSASRSNTSQTSDSKVDHSFFDTILSIPWDHAEEWGKKYIDFFRLPHFLKTS